MSSTESLVDPLDPIEWLRANPRMFFKSGEFEEETVIGILIREAMSSAEVTHAWATKINDWIAVAADADWLDGNTEAFAKPTYFPEGGQNASRMIALLSAFCEAVSTASQGNREDIRTLGGSKMPREMIEYLANHEISRVIVFRTPLSSKVDHVSQRPQVNLGLENAIATLPERDREFANA
jgi:hypothetical protein